MNQSVRVGLLLILLTLGLDHAWAGGDDDGPYFYGANVFQLIQEDRHPQALQSPENLPDSLPENFNDQTHPPMQEELSPPRQKPLGWFAVCGFSVGKSALTTALEFPAERAMVQMQGDQTTDFSKACKKIWHQEGATGFYRGWMPAYLRTLAKTGYQWSWIATLQNTSISRNLDQMDPTKNLKNAFIGVGIACLDTAVLAPIEKAKVQAILNTGTIALEGCSSRKAFNHWIRSNPYQGSSPFFAEQLLGWMLFLMGQNQGQIQAKKYFGEEYASVYKPALGLLLGGVETGVVLPFSNIRTQMILNGQSWTGRQLAHSVQKLGTRGLYYGWKPALLKSAIAGVCDIYLISHLDSQEASRSQEELM